MRTAAQATTQPHFRLTDAQRKLAADHVSLAYGMAAKMNKRLPQVLRGHDRISDACLGLIAAARKYDPQRGFTFNTLARHCVRGRMLDGLRDEDFRPRVAQRRGDRLPVFVPLSKVISEDDKVVTMAHVLADKSEPVGFGRAQADAVRALTFGLGPRAREILQRIYADGATQVEVATEMGLHPSRLSQIVKVALRFLREQHAKKDPRR